MPVFDIEEFIEPEAMRRALVLLNRRERSSLAIAMISSGVRDSAAYTRSLLEGPLGVLMLARAKERRRMLIFDEFFGKGGGCIDGGEGIGGGTTGFPGTPVKFTSVLTSSQEMTPVADMLNLK